MKKVTYTVTIKFPDGSGNTHTAHGKRALNDRIKRIHRNLVFVRCGGTYTIDPQPTQEKK